MSAAETCAWCGEVIEQIPGHTKWGAFENGAPDPWACRRRLPPSDPRLRAGRSYDVRHVPMGTAQEESQ